MKRLHALAFVSICSLLAPTLLNANDLSRYRGFELGMTLEAAAKRAGKLASHATVAHQLPVLMHDLEWQPQNGRVRHGLLSFYGGELSRIVLTHDCYEIKGMTSADMIDGISKAYGTTTRPVARVQYRSQYGDSADVLARREDSTNTFDLVPSGEGSTFVLILYATRADALAQIAIAEALRLDAQEAPQREQEQQGLQEQQEHPAAAKARAVNKPRFRPMKRPLGFIHVSRYESEEGKPE